jgi:hypothetical protein
MSALLPTANMAPWSTCGDKSERGRPLVYRCVDQLRRSAAQRFRTESNCHVDGASGSGRVGCPAVQIEPIRSHFSQRMWWDRQWDRVRRLGIDKEKQQLMEESRSRWGDRTSNPGGAARRSQVGSTPILLRHLHASCDDERCQCAEACKRGSGRHGASCSIQGLEPALCGGCRECPFAAVPLPVPTEGQASFNSIVSTQLRAA